MPFGTRVRGTQATRRPKIVLTRELNLEAYTTGRGTRLMRPVSHGKFIYAGAEKLWVRGATYGAFRPDEEKREYQDLARIDRDFEQMSRAGFNAMRIPHTMPPRHVLDIATRHGLRVMVGLSAEQY